MLLQSASLPRKHCKANSADHNVKTWKHYGCYSFQTNEVWSSAHRTEVFLTASLPAPPDAAADCWRPGCNWFGTGWHGSELLPHWLVGLERWGWTPGEQRNIWAASPETQKIIYPWLCHLNRINIWIFGWTALNFCNFVSDIKPKFL